MNAESQFDALVVEILRGKMSRDADRDIAVLRAERDALRSELMLVTPRLPWEVVVAADDAADD